MRDQNSGRIETLANHLLGDDPKVTGYDQLGHAFLYLATPKGRGQFSQHSVKAVERGGALADHHQREAAPGAQHSMISQGRSEEHTSELQSRLHLVCRLLLEKK